MRCVLGTAALAICLVSSAARASDAPGSVAMPAGMRLATGTITRHEAMIVPDLRLRLDVASTSLASALGDYRDRVQQRLAGTMIDFYPIDGQGFHLSGGTRFYAVSNFSRDAERATNGLLYSPRGVGLRGRAGFKRYTPAMTFGYARMVDQRLSIGVEAGTMFGRAFAAMPKKMGYATIADGGDRRSGVNPLVNMAFALHF